MSRMFASITFFNESQTEYISHETYLLQAQQPSQLLQQPPQSMTLDAQQTLEAQGNQGRTDTMWTRIGFCATMAQKLRKEPSKSSIQGVCGT